MKADKKYEIKKLILSSLDIDTDPEEILKNLENKGVSYDFKEGFMENVLRKLSSPALAITREMEFVKYLNFAFYRIALTGVAAIIILLISIFLMEGSLSFNSFLGLNDGYDESIVFLLTGN